MSVALSVSLVAAACTSGAGDASEAVDEVTTTLSSDGGAAQTSISSDDAAESSGTDEGGEDPNVEVEPARRVPSQISSETNHWIGHGHMTEDAVEVAWSEVEGDDVVYQIFRFDSIGLDREAVELATPIHEGIGTLGWTDETVEAGQFYTYILRVIADGEVFERRWTNTLAVTDVTPPPQISGLTASVTDEGVLLEWAPTDDDVEFGSYGVFRTDVADEAQYVGGGGDLGVTSFIDNDLPSSGEVGYEVVAFDFHGNMSEPVAITVSLP